MTFIPQANKYGSEMSLNTCMFTGDICLHGNTLRHLKKTDMKSYILRHGLKNE